MYLPGIEAKPAAGKVADMMAHMRAEGMPIPQIWHLFAYKPAMTRHLADFTQEVMRGPSPLPPGMRELIAAFTSRLNQCLF
jgi:alkylhydroperoxidase family enzyme